MKRKSNLRLGLVFGVSEHASHGLGQLLRAGAQDLSTHQLELGALIYSYSIKGRRYRRGRR